MLICRNINWKANYYSSKIKCKTSIKLKYNVFVFSNLLFKYRMISSYDTFRGSDLSETIVYYCIAYRNQTVTVYYMLTLYSPKDSVVTWNTHHFSPDKLKWSKVSSTSKSSLFKRFVWAHWIKQAILYKGPAKIFFHWLRNVNSMLLLT